jgi:hypothetical protein
MNIEGDSMPRKRVTTGIQLRRLRYRSAIATKDIAAELGVSHARVAFVETQPIVTPDMAARYKTAVRAIVDRRKNATDEVSQGVRIL